MEIGEPEKLKGCTLLADLSQAISAYRNGDASIDEFVDWFRAASRGMFGAPPQVLNACLAVEAALSELQYGGMSESDFGVALGEAEKLKADWERANPGMLCSSDTLLRLAKPYTLKTMNYGGFTLQLAPMPWYRRMWTGILLGLARWMKHGNSI